ncbi:DUF1206 domain-containing protein [Pontibacter sp. JH31]|uniref:DUF1206 domain-containing protein n=1 Tax=Pontibacter aquaedesilientis TaxID=2766980 RepID=A0ABR7XCZ2_9BACT|nr:DUF1206 domain-containing protein [Pontibacter aquaedesilientis]MBD1396168.1 DUF1206 domain-containing protein [Pontibacter aquaedesilientis]
MDLSAVTSNIPSTKPGWVKTFARIGLIAKGIVYCLVGTLAFMAAFEIGGRSEQSAGKTGVFRFIMEQPYGKVLLGIVALGMLCYTLWRFIQAIADTEDKGTDAKGIGRRIGYAFSGLVYGALAFTAAQLVMGNSSSGSSDSRQTLARELLAQPFGQWLLGAVAIGTMAVGIYQFYRAYSDMYMKKLQASRIKPEMRDTLVRAGKIGYIARGFVWLIIGYLLLQAALNSNFQKAGSSSQAFQFLEENAYGSYLLGALALGLLSYGVFMFVRAKYEVINTDM